MDPFDILSDEEPYPKNATGIKTDQMFNHFSSTNLFYVNT